ncbi:MAG: ATP-binding protein [Planctomycetota bacterium]
MPVSDQITIPAEAAALKDVRAFIRRHLADHTTPDALEDLVLALDEACANVIRHREPDLTDGEIHLRLHHNGPAVTFQIDAYCSASQMGQVKPRDLEDVRPGGLGMHFIQHAMDRVRFIPDRGHPGSVTLVLDKTLPPPAADPAP